MTCKFAAGNNPATVHMDKQWQTSWTTSDVWNYNFHGMNQGSLNYPLWGDQTIQIKCIYNSYIVILRDFSYNGAFLGVGTIMTLANSLVEKPSAINPSWNGHELSGPPIMSTAWSTEHCQMVATCMVGKRRAYGSIQFDCRRILCHLLWGLLLGRGQTLQALLEFQEIHGLFLLALVEIVWSAKDELFSKAYTHIDCRKAQWLFLLVFPWFCCHCRCLQCSWSWSCRLPCAFPEFTADGFTGQKRVLADTRPILGEAECEEDPCSLRMHTTFGFQRGMMGSCCKLEAMIRQERWCCN